MTSYTTFEQVSLVSWSPLMIVQSIFLNMVFSNFLWRNTTVIILIGVHMLPQLSTKYFICSSFLSYSDKTQPKVKSTLCLFLLLLLCFLLSGRFFIIREYKPFHIHAQYWLLSCVYIKLCLHYTFRPFLTSQTIFPRVLCFTWWST